MLAKKLVDICGLHSFAGVFSHAWMKSITYFDYRRITKISSNINFISYIKLLTDYLIKESLLKNKGIRINYKMDDLTQSQKLDTAFK